MVNLKCFKFNVKFCEKGNRNHNKIIIRNKDIFIDFDDFQIYYRNQDFEQLFLCIMIALIFEIFAKKLLLFIEFLLYVYIYDCMYINPKYQLQPAFDIQPIDERHIGYSIQ